MLFCFYFRLDYDTSAREEKRSFRISNTLEMKETVGWETYGLQTGSWSMISGFLSMPESPKAHTN